MPEAKSSGSQAFGCIVLLIIGAGVVGWLYRAIWNEQEGEAKYEDRRNKITIQEGSADTYSRISHAPM